MQSLLIKVFSPSPVTPTCPRCKSVIASDNVNVAKDIAFCRACNLSFELSALTTALENEPNADLSQPPQGTWFHQDASGTVAGATHRAIAQAIPLLLFALFWNGIVSVFVMFAVASGLRHLGISLPAWFPVMSSKGNALPLGMTLFLCLFLTPFIAIGLSMFAAFLSSLGGRTELRVQGSEATLFSGIGPLGFRKRFLLSDVKSVRLENKFWRNSNGNARNNVQIVLERQTGKPYRFGSTLSEERRNFLATAMRKALNAS